MVVDGGLREALGLVLDDEGWMNNVSQHEKEEGGVGLVAHSRGGCSGGTTLMRGGSSIGMGGPVAPRGALLLEDSSGPASMSWWNEEEILHETPRMYHDGDLRQKRTWLLLGTHWYCHAV
jgi:hypothetical protein